MLHDQPELYVHTDIFRCGVYEDPGLRIEAKPGKEAPPGRRRLTRPL